ncbi:protoporphyrinogen oxidase HemJ [Cyanobacterium aponinum UTEX 3222]|uniref:Protoporphyrinogen IX oxidase n=2 Tax=Cyanobacterium aponinum TaxID=379064 RepID=A0A844GV85_9CHRO|nr:MULTISPECIES: protoporphyrinogen oxidase HemJ [Cyanobacterium]WRL40663.1 protoporphyrinogen oxidase HemJ [Cyanobacterium aponinum UTEX 3222]MBD2392862.1 protoporphyrinogen oxidase HemJ [Cyanobacterium aponinum FACHB-4101]MTF37956.1 protoporphyrinogen oxidase HemJ [Cyanobacterium aponinum 0216]PHV62008.1 TIGR00701 family protein [Cyanobacterium aponinum IPPAS B-1201]WPF87109.1 protoporphyrinogen oxidase HemJ [Cyanobacterium aponinum AL20115]
MAYYWFKAFHIIGIVVWFAGLFYLVRLFVYHAEAQEKPEPAQSILKKQYELMEKRLYNIITTPGMVVTVAMAIGLISTEPEILKSGWLHIKLLFVALLLIYHFWCGRIMKQLEKGENNWNGQKFRALNEAPTLLLVVIVLLAIFKNNLPLDITTWLIVGLVVLMAASIQYYAKIRRQNEEKLNQSENLVNS